MMRKKQFKKNTFFKKDHKIKNKEYISAKNKLFFWNNDIFRFNKK